jgi:hypothetical protein
MRIVVIILGVIALLSGGACAVGGGVTAALFGPDGRFQSEDARFGSDTHALVFEADDIADEEPSIGDLDPSDIKVRIRATSTDSTKPLFIGLGRAEDVDAYLEGFEHEVVTDVADVDPFELRTETTGGSGEPDPPADQSFWLEFSSGTGRQQIEHGVESGDFRVVMMNADGSPGFDVDGSIGVKVPYIFPIAIGLLVAGIIVAVIGLAAIIAAAVTMGGPKPVPAAAIAGTQTSAAVDTPPPAADLSPPTEAAEPRPGDVPPADEEKLE